MSFYQVTPLWAGQQEGKQVLMHLWFYHQNAASSLSHPRQEEQLNTCFQKPQGIFLANILPSAFRWHQTMFFHLLRLLGAQGWATQ